MIEFSLFGFPVRVHWTFWLLAFFLGGGFYARDPDDWTRVLVAVGVIFGSILVHELGHAFAGQHFRARPEIMLMGTGGLCSLPGARFTRPQHIFVSFAGPMAGFALAALLYLGAGAVPHHQVLLRQAVAIGLFVNIVWNVLNLLPILPLDGGQILRDLLGPRYGQFVRWTGAATGTVLAALALTNGFIFAGVIAAALAYANFQGSTIEGGVQTDNDRRRR